MKSLLLPLLFISLTAVAETSTFICGYEQFATPDGLEKPKRKFVLTFIVDRSSHKAYVLGNQGSEEVKLLETSEQLVFIELTATGNIMTTTIDSKLQTVHSRHSVLFDGLVPSQYYGNCIIK